MSRRLAIFDATPASYAGGYERFVDALRDAALEEGWEAEIVRPPARQFLTAVTIMGVRRRFAHIAGDTAPGSNLEFLRDATHLYVKNELLDLWWLSHLRSSLPRTVGFHTPLRYPGNSLAVRARNTLFYDNFVYGASLRNARLHFLNKFDLNALVRSARPQATAIIPNGIEGQEVNVHASSPFSLLFVGRLTEQKGLDRLSWIADRGDLPVLNCVGDGPDRELLEKRFGRAANFLGGMPRDGALDALRAHSVLVMPSRWEGLPLVLLEAMSLGCVPLVSDLPMMVDVLPEQFRWLAVNFDDRDMVSGALARLRSLHASQEHWTELRRGMVDRVREHYIERTQMSKLLKFIEGGDS